MEKHIIICDICGRDCAKVNTPASSGRGSLEFTWSLGGAAGGGTRDTIEKPDICCECTWKMRAAINRAIMDCYKQAREG